MTFFGLFAGPSPHFRDQRLNLSRIKRKKDRMTAPIETRYNGCHFRSRREARFEHGQTPKGLRA